MSETYVTSGGQVPNPNFSLMFIGLVYESYCTLHILQGDFSVDWTFVIMRVAEIMLVNFIVFNGFAY